MQRIICHLDMDAFFASVEEKHDPSLKGKPVLVAAGPVGRGAVASCNYVARRLGVKTGMSTQEAIRNFPNAVVVRANYEWYQEASEQILRIIYRFTPDVEPLSLDEAFFELTHVQHRWPDPLAAAEAIQRTIDEELSLGASIGISSGKALAKIASDFKKPHGITVVPFGYEMDWIDPLPIEAVPGVGSATHRKLSELGIVTCGDICKLNLGLLHKIFGNVHGSYLWNLVHGVDERPLMKRGAAKSISHQSTLQKTTSDKDYVESLLLYIAERCLWRLRKSGMKTRGLSIYMRFADQRYAQRVCHLKEATQSEQIIFPLVSRMTREMWAANPRPRVTFIGVHLSDFQPATPQEKLFFDETEKKERLSRAMSGIREKFGAPIITSARTFGLHHSYRLAQAGLSFTVMKVEEEESASMVKREAGGYLPMEVVE
ncbi:MAG TPA: DNA polymerase IV [Candidatus Kapabacteria bacterium]|nr:DNA polymerase IV [Candidatus Kapabacteria bacterium]